MTLPFLMARLVLSPLPCTLPSLCIHLYVFACIVISRCDFQHFGVQTQTWSLFIHGRRRVKGKEVRQLVLEYVGMTATEMITWSLFFDLPEYCLWSSNLYAIAYRVLLIFTCWLYLWGQLLWYCFGSKQPLHRFIQVFAKLHWNGNLHEAVMRHITVDASHQCGWWWNKPDFPSRTIPNLKCMLTLSGTNEFHFLLLKKARQQEIELERNCQALYTILVASFWAMMK